MQKILLILSLSLVACEPTKNEESSFKESTSSVTLEGVDPVASESDVVRAVPEEEQFVIEAGNEQIAYLAFTSCLDAKEKIVEAKNGVYKLYYNDDAGQPVMYDAVCDMEAEGGGWTLVLNYVHAANTNPPTVQLADKFPRQNSNNLGDDEQNTDNFGHLVPALLSQWTFTELRFFCRSSGHNRVLHFRTDSATCLDYLKTGAGNCDDLANNFTALTGHTASLPATQANGTNDALDLAMTDRTIRDQNSTTNWDINNGNGDDDWECDDDVDNSSNSTIHRIWFR